MLNIRIEDPEIEKSIKQDIGVSIEEIAVGKGIPLATVINDISSKYE